MPEDELVISFKSTVVYKRDKDLLQPGFWLNDILISFWLEILEHVPDIALGIHMPLVAPRHTYLVQPTTVSLYNYLEPLDLCESLRSLKLNEFDRILFPISDADIDSSNPHGSHWTLLLFDRLSVKLYHFDSARNISNGRNLKVATNFIKALWPLLCEENKSRDQSLLPVTHPKIEEGICGQQTNGSDCGPHVLLCIERVLIKELSLTDSISKEKYKSFIESFRDLSEGTTPMDAHKFRNRYNKVLETFKSSNN
jgi:hypothetical protein